MPRAGEGLKPVRPGAGRGELARHVAGHEAVVLAVDEEDGYFRPADGLERARPAQVKAAEEPRAEAQEGEQGPGGQVRVL